MPKQDHFLNLLDVVSPEFLKDLLNRFSEATDVKTLITDNLGKPLIWSDHPNGLFCPFCARMRADYDRSIECQKSDALAGISAFHKKLPFIYRCPNDLIEVAVPIIINEQYLGVIMIGQLRVEDEKHVTLPKSLLPTFDLTSDAELKKLHENTKKELPFIPLYRLQALANMLHSVANYIAEISVNSLLKDAYNQLNMRIADEENYKIELEKSLKEKELHRIEMDLKPQYLFNVLNTINNLVLLEDPQRASEVISSLSQLIRYNLKHSNQFSTIAEEYESIQNYLRIKELSSENNIEIKTSIDDKCLDALIPPFSIQPLVQSAFTHGLDTKLDGGKFRLDITKLGTEVKITVADNGTGIPLLPKSHLLAFKKSELSNTTSFTLINILKILRHYFQDEFSWDVESLENQGTTITISIPFWPKEGGGYS